MKTKPARPERDLNHIERRHQIQSQLRQRDSICSRPRDVPHRTNGLVQVAVLVPT
ncbi:hypothetical protein BC777_2706 [Yoonia maricola]|uniref:Uncharacterized protein n=1 Tax=Yoonia maricola TaxID=420999 RepID=A0A2M8W5X4_9RHOB|nr:hypothetical protein BC777_2706 [Yoonia maricola]